MITAPGQKVTAAVPETTIKPATQSERKILIVEADPSLANFLRNELGAASYFAQCVHGGREALNLLQNQNDYGLMILDLNLPDLDGMEVLRETRQVVPRVAALVLTARNRVDDKVQALQNGADDYLVKPFSLRELMARVQALLRRDTPAVPNMSRVGDLVLMRDERRVERNGRRIELTPREFALLEFLIRNAGRPVARATLYENVWNAPFDPSSNVVDVYMKYVRDKVDLQGEQKLTHTIRGIGYELRES